MANKGRGLRGPIIRQVYERGRITEHKWGESPYEIAEADQPSLDIRGSRPWKAIHTPFGSKTQAVRTLWGREATRKTRIKRALENEIAGDDNLLHLSTTLMLQNAGAIKPGQKIDRNKLAEHKDEVVEALTGDRMQKSILQGTHAVPIYGVMRLPIYPTVAGKVTSEASVAKTFKGELRRAGVKIKDLIEKEEEPYGEEERPYGEGEEEGEELRESVEHMPEHDMTLNELLRRMAYKHISLKTGSPHAQAINTDEVGNNVEETFHNAGQFAALVGWKADRKDFKTTLRRMLKVAKASASPAEMIKKLKDEMEAIRTNPTVLQKFNRMEGMHLVDHAGKDITDYQNEIHIANITSLGQAVAFWYFAHRARDLENPAHQRAYETTLRKYAKGYEGNVRTFLRQTVGKIPKTWD